VVKLKSSVNKNVTAAGVTSGKVEASLNKNVTTARVTSPLGTLAIVTFLFKDDFNFTTSNSCCSNVFV
jgi:hypothetical protein